MEQNISNYLKAAGICLLISLATVAVAQNEKQDLVYSDNTKQWKSERKVAILLGTSQLLIAKGFNIEGNYIHKKLIFDYSHGFSLDYTDDLLTTELKENGLVVHIPWTTGFGVGYRFTEWLNLRVEPKWHCFEFYYEGEAQNKTNEIASYNTFTLGLGMYGFFQPFKNKSNFLKGITIAPSIRFWPTVNSTLKGDKFQYSNKNTGSNETIETLDVGIGFTPLIINVGVGYSFQIKKRK